MPARNLDSKPKFKKRASLSSPSSSSIIQINASGCKVIKKSIPIKFGKREHSKQRDPHGEFIEELSFGDNFCLIEIFRRESVTAIITSKIKNK